MNPPAASPRDAGAVKSRLDAAAAEFSAMSAAVAIAQMDPYTLDDLAQYLHDLRRAHQNHDADAARYIVDAIAELFRSADMRAAPDLDRAIADTTSTPAGRRAAARIEAEADTFRQRYLDLKARTGFTTIRQLARAAGISPTTAHAIDAGSIAPQWRTLEKLAAAFNSRLPEDQHITAAHLRGC